MLNKIKQYIVLDGIEKKLFAEAYVTLGIMRLAVLTVSFKRLAASLEQSQFYEESVALTEQERVIAQTIGRAVQRAANHTPWKSACLVQALAAQKMLQKRNVPGRFYLGVAKEETVADSMKAHAWLQCDDIILTGEGGYEDFTVLSVFSWGRK